tara:strand:- start:2217 stop:2456 length:240 start_codon:yes stop_codon:yes gene_type:complete
MKNKKIIFGVCPTANYLECLAEEKQINAIGFVKGGRELLDSQEHIFVENLVDCEKTIFNELPTEQKLELYKQKHLKGGN